MMWMFQSAPPPLGGGDLDRDQLDENPNCFNPRPPRLEGATPYHGVGASDGVVSIRAPPAWRGRPQDWFCRLSPVSFNPRPPRLEGATALANELASREHVSIRAPPAWRGRLRPMTPRAAQARFNPRPPRLEGATSVL